MKFKVRASELVGVVDVVSVVPAKAQQDGPAGLKFVVEGDRCTIYSTDGQRQAQAFVEISEVDGEGSFVVPSSNIGSIRYLDGDEWVEFEATSENGSFSVKYETQSGANGDWATFDPREISSMGESVESLSGTEAEFPAAILREALSTCKAFALKSGETRSDRECFKTVQLFDASEEAWAKGNGHMFAADGIRSCYFHSTALEDKGLAVHAQHLPFLASFLAKSEGLVKVRVGSSVTYLTNSKGQSLGWTHHTNNHAKFSYYPYAKDGFVLLARKDQLVKALKFVRSNMGKSDKIRVAYTHADKSLRFVASDGSSKNASMPVGVKPLADEDWGQAGSTSDVAFNASADSLIELVDAVKGFEVTLRLAVVNVSGKDRVLIRTVEEFSLTEGGKVVVSQDDSKEVTYPCRVTRFMPSKD